MSKSEDTLMKVLKKATCKTLSGNSTLTYHVGADTDDEIHVRVHANHDEFLESTIDIIN